MNHAVFFLLIKRESHWPSLITREKLKNIHILDSFKLTEYL